MQRLLEMKTEVDARSLFRRPQQKPSETFNKLYPDFHRVACDKVNTRRLGRPSFDVGDRNIIRLHVSHSVPHHEKHVTTQISTSACYPIIGNNAVETVRYTEPRRSADKGLVWINQKQYFKGVPPEVWNFRLGGSQICQKWLKEREGRSLSNKDIQHYQRIVTALKEMIELMAGIDAAIFNGKFKQEKFPLAANKH